jgi:hypothetical protein
VLRLLRLREIASPPDLDRGQSMRRKSQRKRAIRQIHRLSRRQFSGVDEVALLVA